MVGVEKAINNTTVEVTFTEEVEDVKALDFAIEGLDITNASVKQTNSKVVVLTTSAQTADVDYKVTVDGEAIGSFKGIGAVIPTSIKVETTSVQSKVGAQVTLKATTTPGAAVTFNVQATGNSLNENKKVEVTAGTDGVATYSYTQYGVAGVDNVTVYPTGAPSLLGYAKVYWGQSDILTVDAEEKTVDNGGNRLYTVTYKDPTTGQPVSGKTLNVTFKENLNDIDASKTNDTTASIRKSNGTYVTPYQDSSATAGTNREEAFQIVTNSVGQATFTVTGKNTTATPVVFADADANSRFGATELQATAGSAKFQGVQSPYTITFERTTDFVAALSSEHGGQQNPIAYKLKVVTDKKDDKGNAKPYVGATIKVAIQQNQDATLTNNTPAQIAAKENGSYNANHVVEVTTDSKGEATVYLKSAVDNTKATPVAWIDLNSAGNNAGTVGNNKLEDGEPNAVAPSVTFLKSVVVAPGYTLNTATAGSYVTGDRMTWTASLENQSGNVSETAGVKNATYTITNTSNRQLTFNPRLVDEAGKNYTDLTVTYNDGTQTRSFVNGSAVTLEPGTTVTIHGVGSDFRAATTTVAEYSTTNDALLHIDAPNVNGSLSVSANVTTVRKVATGDSRNDNNTYTYDAKTAEFVSAVAATGVVTGEVIGYEISDKSTNPSVAYASTNKFNRNEANNYGRVVIKERHTGAIKVYYYGSADSFSAALDGVFNTQTTDNRLDNTGSPAASKFESILTVGDEIQTGATAGGQIGTVRLFNKDASTGGKTSGNGVRSNLAIASAKTIHTGVAGSAVNQIEVVFNNPVTQAQLNQLASNVGSTILSDVSLRLADGSTANVSNPTAVGTNTVHFTVAGGAVNDTAAFANSTLEFGSSSVSILTGTTTTNTLTTTVADGALPFVVSGAISDADTTVGYDTVQFTLSEAVNQATIDAADFRITNSAVSPTATVSGKSFSVDTTGKVVTVKFDNTTGIGNAIVPTLDVSYASHNSSNGNLSLADKNGNLLATTVLNAASTPALVQGGATPPVFSAAFTGLGANLTGGVNAVTAVPAVAGKYTVTIGGTTAVATDTVTIDGVALALPLGTYADNNAVAAAVVTLINANTTLNAKYTASATGSVVTLIQKAGQESPTAPTAPAISTAGGTVTQAQVTLGVTGVTGVTGVAASGSFTVASVPVDGTIITIGGKKIGFNAAGASVAGADFTIHTGDNNTINGVASAIEAYLATAGGSVTKGAAALSTDAVVSLQAATTGLAGNSLTTGSSN